MLDATAWDDSCLEFVLLDDGIFPDAGCCEDELNSVPPGVIPLPTLTEPDVCQIADDAIIDTELVIDAILPEDEFSLSIVYVNGEACIPITEFPTHCSTPLNLIPSTNLIVPELLLNEEEGDEYELNLQATVSSALNATSHPLTVNPLREGYNSTADPNFLGEYDLSPDYIAITVPALPKGYYLPLNFGGTATLGGDYMVYVPQGQVGHLSGTSNGYEYAGGSFTFYIVPFDDYHKELDETVTVSIGDPWSIDPMTTIPYQFTSTVPSVTATIIDNDDWRVSVQCLSEEDEQGNIVLKESTQDYAFFKIVRQDAGANRSGDLQYPVMVQLAITGDVTTSDYSLYAVNPDSSLSLVNPSNSGIFTVTIPAGSVETTIKIQAVDDNIVEQLDESLVLTVQSAQCGYANTSYVHDTTGTLVKIRDNDLLTISTVKFIDNRDLLSDTSGTFDTNWKNATQHWTASDPTATLPVCYACTDSMSCKITVAGNYDANRTFLVRMKWTYNLGDDQSCAYSSWTNLTTDTTVLLPFTFHTYFAQQRAYYDLDSTLSWEFKTANDGEDRGEDGDMGESQHPLYITYSAPVSGAEMYHTTVHLGCVAAGSMSAPSDEADVFNAIWTKIASKLNYKVNMVNGVVTTGELLTYYGKEPIGIDPDVTIANIIAGATYMIQDGEYITELPSLAREVDVAQLGGYSQSNLLKYGDGTCGSWQSFAYNIFGTQGISVERRNIVRVGTLEITGNSGKIRHLEMRVNPSLQGQGLVTPKENTWSNHAIFVYNNEIYDPSYGVAYGHKDSALSLFINNLHSIGYSENTPHDGYGWEYTPTKYPIDITSGDFVFDPSFDSN